MTVVDVGANQGLYTLLFAALVGPEGHVLAFEPDPVLCAALRANLLRNRVGNVTVYEVALGSRAEQRLLRRSAVNSGDNRLTLESDVAAADSIAVGIEPLDGILDGRRADFVKIDVQGWELEVLRGMVQTLQSLPPPTVFFEYSPSDLQAAGSAPADIWTFFGSHNFEIFGLSGGGLTKLAGPESVTLSQPFGYTNLLAKRDDHGR